MVFGIIFKKNEISVLINIMIGSIIDNNRIFGISHSINFYKVISIINVIKNWYINCFVCKIRCSCCLTCRYQIFQTVNFCGWSYIEVIFWTCNNNPSVYCPRIKWKSKTIFLKSLNSTFVSGLGIEFGTNTYIFSNGTLLFVVGSKVVWTINCKIMVFKVIGIHASFSSYDCITKPKSTFPG